MIASDATDLRKRPALTEKQQTLVEAAETAYRVYKEQKTKLREASSQLTEVCSDAVNAGVSRGYLSTHLKIKWTTLNDRIERGAPWP